MLLLFLVTRATSPGARFQSSGPQGAIHRYLADEQCQDHSRTVPLRTNGGAALADPVPRLGPARVLPHGHGKTLVTGPVLATLCRAVVVATD